MVLIPYEKLVGGARRAGSPLAAVFSSAPARRRLFVVLPLAAVSVFLAYTLVVAALPHASQYIDQYYQSGDGAVNVVRGEDPRANATLGFADMAYLNLRDRYDFDDAIALQASIAELRLRKFEAVEMGTMNLKGLPPSSTPDGGPSTGGRACYRSHANMWRHMIENNLETLLIVEADAVWDAQVRRQFGHFSQGLEAMLLQLGAISNSTESGLNETATPADPYLHRHWELLQFGGCFEKGDLEGGYLRYADPYAATPKDPFFDGEPYGEGQRIVRAQNELVCTTGYALTRRGAQKLLLRAAMDMDQPVDLLIGEMVRERRIKAFSVSPYLFAQWEYRDNIGANSKNSDIDPVADGAVAADVIKETWRDSHQRMSVWSYNGMYRHAQFKDSALHRMREHFYEEE